MTETHLAETMDLAGKRAAYDNACKQLLAHKQILAQILCGTMRVSPRRCCVRQASIWTLPLWRMSMSIHRVR